MMIAYSERRIVQDYESSFGGRKYWSVAWRWERVFDYPKKINGSRGVMYTYRASFGWWD